MPGRSLPTAFMQLNTFTSKRLRRPATWLALLLLLATTGLQAAELSHLHSPLDTAEHCLLCKADGQGLAVATTAQTSVTLAGPAPAQGRPSPTAAAVCDLPKARGPPSHF